MKTRLTVTIEGALVAVAKQFARARGTSVSALVEDALRGLIAADARSDQSFGDRWRGTFRPAEGDDLRHEALARKYL